VANEENVVPGTVAEREPARWRTDGRRPGQLLELGLMVWVSSFVLSYVIGAGSYELRAGAGMAGCFGFVIAFVMVALEFTRLEIRGWPALLRSAAVWALVFSPFGGILMAGVLAEYGNDRFVTATKSACKELIRILEEQRRVTGSYPETAETCLRGIADPAHQELLATIEYRRDGRGERFCLWFFDQIDNLGGRPSVHLYDSKRVAWFFSNDSSFEFSFEEDLFTRFRPEGDTR